jgi:hypothetical protein
MTQSPLLRCIFPQSFKNGFIKRIFSIPLSQEFLAIACLSRQKLIALHRVGLRYQINLMNQGGPSVRRSNIGKSRMLNIGNAPALCEVLSGILVRL